jgi:hypothetical protein
VLVKAAEAQRIDYGADLLEQTRRIQSEALAVLDAAKLTGNHGGVLAAVDRLQRGVALLAAVLDRGGAAADRELVIRWE